MKEQRIRVGDVLISIGIDVVHPPPETRQIELARAAGNSRSRAGVGRPRPPGTHNLGTFLRQTYKHGDFIENHVLERQAKSSRIETGKSTISNIMSKLAKKGLVEKTPETPVNVWRMK